MADNIVFLDNGVFTHKPAPDFLAEYVTTPITNRTAGAILTANKLVAINATGQVIHADAATNKAAIGFITSSYLNGATDVVVQKTNYIVTGLTGLTIGADYFLGANGAYSATGSITSGTTFQKIGVALSATELLIAIEPPIVGA